MKRKNTIMIAIAMISALVLAGCTTEGKNEVKVTENSTQKEVKSEKIKGQELTDILSKTNWQGTKVYDENKNDLTEENSNFIGLAKYDGTNGRYEFYDAQTKESRGDSGVFFITNDGNKRILISETMNYQAAVELTELTNEKFTYQRTGKDEAGNDIAVFVEHVPYDETELEFTGKEATLDTTTGTIDTKENGSEILGKSLWNGTKVLDENGEDVTEYNSNFISIAKFEASTSKYEFFNLETGESRNDFGYYDVLDKNKIRTHMSIGENNYGAVLELTELNDKKFTYKRMGKDGAGNEIVIFVEHEPYAGKFTPAFSF